MTSYKQLALGLLCVLFVIGLASLHSTTVPLWYTQGDSLKATITLQWLTFGKTVFNRDGRIFSVALAADSAAFADSINRVAIYIPGAKATDLYTATPRYLTETIPDADDVIGCTAKIDSMIATTRPGHTLGLKFVWQERRKGA